MINRNLYENILNTIKRDKSVILFGPRQTGKTTLVKTFNYDRYINLMDNALRQRYEGNLNLFPQEMKLLKKSLNKKPLIIIDEVQKIPDITDSIQLLIDDNVANFIITGSSVRRIKNLLPGRVIKFEMSALSIEEAKELDLTLEHFLINGSLPGIATLNEKVEIEQELLSYVSLYLEEEVRKESLTRNLGAFNNFLKLACIESGNIVNLSKISQEIGVAHTTISSYYQILIDCMIAKKIEPLTKDISRRRLNKSPKYIIFDLGIRRAAAGESNNPTIKQMSFLFEQFVGLELGKIVVKNKLNKNYNLFFWRVHSGPEIDFVLESQGLYIPIEVKWTESPNIKDAKHLIQFSKEYSVEKSYIVCRTPYSFEVSENVFAISWNDLNLIFN